MTCGTCNGSGLICNICGEAEPVCGCSPEDIEQYIEDFGEQFDDCGECGGEGTFL